MYERCCLDGSIRYSPNYMETYRTIQKWNSRLIENMGVRLN